MANFIRGFFEEGARWAGAITAICALIYGGWLVGSPLAVSFVSSVVESHKLETIEHVDAVRRDVLAIVQDRKLLGEKREAQVTELKQQLAQQAEKRETQIEDVNRQLAELARKIEGADQRLTAHIQGLQTNTANILSQLNTIVALLPVRQGAAVPKFQDRIFNEAEGAP